MREEDRERIRRWCRGLDVVGSERGVLIQLQKIDAKERHVHVGRQQ